MVVTLIILLVTIGLFVWGKYPPDLVAVLSMLSLFLTNVLTLEETLSGFSNSTVIMIAGLFIIGEGLAQTGWTAVAGQSLIIWSKNRIKRLLVLITLGSGTLSGFVSNTGTVATLLPLTVAAAWNIGTFPSKLLMPVAFGSNTGGLLTLTGTPPNIIVSNALTESGYEGFGFFEFALVGLPLLLVALIYFYFIGYQLLPKHKGGSRPANINQEMHKWKEEYSFEQHVFRLRIRSRSPLIDTQIKDWNFEQNDGVSLIRLRRRHPSTLRGIAPFVEIPDSETYLRYHDIITVRATQEVVHQLILQYRLGLLPISITEEDLKREYITQEIGMAEMIITPKSNLIGHNIPLGQYLEQLDIQLLGASRNNKPLKGNPIRVRAGDAFLIRGTWEAIERLQNLHANLVISGSPEGMAKDVDQLNTKSWISLGILLLMVLLLVFKIFPAVIGVLVCSGLTLLTGCVPIKKAYKSISWVSVIMIAAMIPMGIALQKTGIAKEAANALVQYLGTIHPYWLLAGIFVLTTGFSQTINNSATAVLMAPIAVTAATQLGVSPEPFLMMVAISASTAFLTPVGTTTNAMVLAAGRYTFTDYLKVGGPLLLLFFVISMLLVPYFWSF